MPEDKRQLQEDAKKTIENYKESLEFFGLRTSNIIPSLELVDEILEQRDRYDYECKDKGVLLSFYSLIMLNSVFNQDPSLYTVDFNAPVVEESNGYNYTAVNLQGEHGGLIGISKWEVDQLNEGIKSLLELKKDEEISDLDVLSLKINGMGDLFNRLSLTKESVLKEVKTYKKRLAVLAEEDEHLDSDEKEADIIDGVEKFGDDLVALCDDRAGIIRSEFEKLFLPYAESAKQVTVKQGVTDEERDIAVSTLLGFGNYAYLVGINFDLREFNFSGLKLGCVSDYDCSFATFDNGNLKRLAADGSNLTSASFKGAYLASACFANATITNADFTNADLTGADLTGVKGLTVGQLLSAKSFDGVIVSDENKAILEEAIANNKAKQIYLDFEKALGSDSGSKMPSMISHIKVKDGAIKFTVETKNSKDVRPAKSFIKDVLQDSLKEEGEFKSEPGNGKNFVIEFIPEANKEVNQAIDKVVKPVKIEGKNFSPVKKYKSLDDIQAPKKNANSMKSSKSEVGLFDNTDFKEDEKAVIPNGAALNVKKASGRRSEVVNEESKPLGGMEISAPELYGDLKQEEKAFGSRLSKASHSESSVSSKGNAENSLQRNSSFTSPAIKASNSSPSVANEGGGGSSKKSKKTFGSRLSRAAHSLRDTICGKKCDKMVEPVEVRSEKDQDSHAPSGKLSFADSVRNRVCSILGR